MKRTVFFALATKLKMGFIELFAIVHVFFARKMWCIADIW